MKEHNVIYANELGKFKLGQIVYLKTDKDQLPRMVTSISLVINGTFRWSLACGTEDTYHYTEEISAEKDEMMSLGIEV